jgi:NarL family two-component system response regulator YdfI
MGPQLSEREIEVLRHIAHGETSKEVAQSLGISERTVNWHIERVFVKLGAGSRAQAVAIALEKGILRRSNDSQTTP